MEDPGVDQQHHRGDVPEAEAGQQRGARRLAQVQRPVVDHQPVPPDHIGVDRVEVPVAGNHSLVEHVAQPRHLPRGCPTLGVSRQALLRDHPQGVPGAAPEQLLEALVDGRFVGVVGSGRGVVLGEHADVVGSEAVGTQGSPEGRVGSAQTDAERSPTGRRYGALEPVGVGAGQPQHRPYGQPELERHAAPADHQRTASR